MERHYTIKELNEIHYTDQLNDWFTKFVKNMHGDLRETEEVRIFSKAILVAERVRNDQYEGRPQERQASEDRLLKRLDLMDLGLFAHLFANNIGLPLTAGGLAMLTLGAEDQNEIVMNAVVARIIMAKAPSILRFQADATFMIPIFGNGLFSPEFYSRMWSEQKIIVNKKEFDLLSMVRASDFDYF